MSPLRLVRQLSLSASLALGLVPSLLQSAESAVVSNPDPLLRGTADSLRTDGPLELGGVPLESGRLLAEFYAARGYRPAWVHSAQVQALLRVVEEGAAEGLKPEDYHLSTLRKLVKPGYLEGLKPAARLAADLQLTDALLRYSYHIRFGRVDPAAVSRAWNHRKPVPAETLVHAMEQVVAAVDTESSLRDLEPQPFFYVNLKRALEEHGASSELAALPPIPPGVKLAASSRDPRVALVRARLKALGETDVATTDDPELFDAALRDSLVRFQRRYGLRADGVASPATVAALNHPFDAKKAEQIRINLERMRWFYDDLPPDYVLVDVAGFMAHVVRDSRIDWSTRVVVGTPKDQTPSFRDEMEHVVFNPTWTVPPTIQKKMRGVSSRFKVVDRRSGRAVGGANVSDNTRYSIVQGPGPTNALGRVKFMFPNDQAVYLHDTQSKGLFGQTFRAYSHGCVRVQNPLKLAEVILNRPNWDQREIGRVISTNKTRYVFLEERIPVLLYYLTAYADENGKVGFRGDIYGRDAALRRAFNGPASQLRIGFPKPQPLVDPDAVMAQADRNRPKPTSAPEQAAPKQAPTPAVESAPVPRDAPPATLTQGRPTGAAVGLDSVRSPDAALEAPAAASNL